MEVEEEERWELSDLLLPQYLNRLSNTWNKTTGFCGNLACKHPHTHTHTHARAQRHKCPTCCRGQLPVNVFKRKPHTFILVKEELQKGGGGYTLVVTVQFIIVWP